MFVEEDCLLAPASGPMNPGSASVPNLILCMGLFQALSLLHPFNFKCSLCLLVDPLSTLYLSSQPLYLLIPNLSCASPGSRGPSPRPCPAQFFKSSSWHSSPGRGPGLPPCLGEEFRRAEGTIQKSLTNEKLIIWSAATCLQGEEGAESLKESLNCLLSLLCHGGPALRIRGPDHGNSMVSWTFFGWQLLLKFIHIFFLTYSIISFP